MGRRINLERWQPHVEEARRRGVTLKAYAAEQGLSLYSLYRASQAMGGGAKEASGTPLPAAQKFVPVRVVSATATAALRVSAHLPNGISVQVEAGSGDVACVIAALAALPCSA
jgi:hypothetical protein